MPCKRAHPLLLCKLRTHRSYRKVRQDQQPEPGYLLRPLTCQGQSGAYRHQLPVHRRYRSHPDRARRAVPGHRFQWAEPIRRCREAVPWLPDRWLAERLVESRTLPACQDRPVPRCQAAVPDRACARRSRRPARPLQRSRAEDCAATFGATRRRQVASKTRRTDSRP